MLLTCDHEYKTRLADELIEWAHRQGIATSAAHCYNATGRVEDSWQRQRLFDVLAQLIHWKAQPLRLFIGDLQWCDEETLTWLHYLLILRSQAR